MKRLLAALFFFSLGFFFSPHITSWSSAKGKLSPLPTLFPAREERITILVIGHNDGAFVQQCFEAIFSQTYKNFSLLYVDNGSDDGSLPLVQELLEGRGNLLSFPLHRKESEIVEEVAALLPSQEVLVVLHAREALAHEWAIDHINRYFQDSATKAVTAEGKVFSSMMPGPKLHAFRSLYAKEEKKILSEVMLLALAEVEP